jgi:hypothetical protein
MAFYKNARQSGNKNLSGEVLEGFGAVEAAGVVVEVVEADNVEEKKFVGGC